LGSRREAQGAGIPSYGASGLFVDPITNEKVAKAISRSLSVLAYATTICRPSARVKAALASKSFHHHHKEKEASAVTIRARECRWRHTHEKWPAPAGMSSTQPDVGFVLASNPSPATKVGSEKRQRKYS
jgi:hypothetical protein